MNDEYAKFTENSDKDFFAVERMADKKVIGNLYFSARDFDAMKLSYVFNRRAWHCGYAAEAVRVLMQFCFETTGCPRVVAECNPLNAVSWKLLERLGMRRERHGIKDHFFSRDANGAPPMGRFLQLCNSLR